MVKIQGGGSYWKVGKNFYSVITKTGKRKGAKTATEARKLAGGKVTKTAIKKAKAKGKSRSSKSSSKKSGGIRKIAKSIGIPSLATMSQVAIPGLFLAARKPKGRVLSPLDAVAQKAYPKALQIGLENARDVFTTLEGWTQVVLPVSAIQFLKKVVGRVRVNIFGQSWSIL